MHRFNVLRPMRVSSAGALLAGGLAGVVLAGGAATASAQSSLSNFAAPAVTGATLPTYQAPHTSIRLLTGGRSEQGGERKLLAAIEIRMEPGWKTYWRSPGGGIAPSFSWDESANLKTAEVLWPAPVRFADGEDISIGYKESVVLPVVVTPQNPDKPVSLSLDVAYGVCKDICMPVEAQLSLDLDAPVRMADYEQMVAAIRRVPAKQWQAGEACPHRFLSARLVESGGQAMLRVETAFNAGAEGRDVMVELPQEAGLGAPVLDEQEKRSGRASYLFPLSADSASLTKAQPVTFTTVSAQGSCESLARVE
jgi:DsbC/DsbD-like thiol-disulfide interchange protein